MEEGSIQNQQNISGGQGFQVNDPTAPIVQGNNNTINFVNHPPPQPEPNVSGTPHNLPYSGAIAFVGRDEDLKQLHEQLQRRSTVAISAIAGMGGIGKTELALQYALKHCQAETYSGGICWLKAREDLAAQIVLFARSHLHLTIPENVELAEQVARCWGQWQEKETLLVFDDVQHYQDIESVLPPQKSHFKILLTTRLQLQEDRVQVINLDRLAPLAAFQLLYEIALDESLAPTEQLIAENLCEWLGYLPLGIKLVANFLKVEPDLSLQGLFEQLKAEKLKQDSLLKIEAVFQLSWEKLSIAEQQLAAILSLFAIAEIQWQWVEDGVQLCRVKPELLGWWKRVLSLGKPLPEPEQWCVLLEPNVLQRGRRRLIELSLLQWVGEGLYQLHPLIREFFAVKLWEVSKNDEMKRAFFRIRLHNFIYSAQEMMQTDCTD